MKNILMSLLMVTTAGVVSAEEGAMKTEKATFAAGCFWGVESAFRQVDGVIDTQAGYTGGKTENPTYKQVCSGATGHAEAIEITFDPEKVSYKTLVELFFKLHDPTQGNRQGPDIGSQYRSAIFYHSDEQKRVVDAVKEELEKRGKYKKPITTQIAPAVPFYRAEEYHQRYIEKKGGSSCHCGWTSRLCFLNIIENPSVHLIT